MEQTLIRSPHNLLVLRSLDGRDHPLSDVTLVGREAECQLQLIEGHASRYHAKLTVTGPQHVLVEDLKSTNGTYVNGQRVETPIVASLGDELRFDTSRFRIATLTSGGAEATVFRSRETFAPAQVAPPPPPMKMQPPQPAPQMMTPAPQQPDFPGDEPAVSFGTVVEVPLEAANLTLQVPAAPKPPPTEAAAVISSVSEAPSVSQAPSISPAPFAGDLPSANQRAPSKALVAKDVPQPAASPQNRDNNSTITSAPAKKPADDRIATSRSKPRKLAEFPDEDSIPATGTSSLPAEEMANLASKSSRTVRRMENNSGPRLIVLNPPARGMIFPLADSGAIGEWLVGRGDDADIALTDRTVSARHAIIRKTGNRWEIENLNATNGVFINGKLISRRIITNGDKIRLGRTEMHFRTDTETGTSAGTRADLASGLATPDTSSGLPSGALLALAGAVFVALFVLILILVLQRGP